MNRIQKNISLLALGILFSVAAGIWLSRVDENSRSADILVWDKGKTEPAFFLFFPWEPGANKNRPYRVELIDRAGKQRHHWDLLERGLFGRILPNRNLLFMPMALGSAHKTKIPGECTGLVEVDWQGREVWRMNIFGVHHDVRAIDNNRYLTIAYEPLRPEVQQKYFPLVSGLAYSDRFLIIDRDNKKIIWDFALQDHWAELADRNERPDYFDTSHSNSVDYLEQHPLTQGPALLASIRELSSVILIDIERKKIVWKSPKNLFRGQHDAQFLEPMKLLIFDNGIESLSLRTRIVEFDLSTNQIIWEWGDPDRLWGAPSMGAVQRFTNGNYLVNASFLGQLIEVTRSGEIVWNYMGRMRVRSGEAQSKIWPGQPFYRTVAYEPGYLGLK